MKLLASDLARAMADPSGDTVPVVWGAISCNGILDTATEDFVSADNILVVRGETPVLTYLLTDLPGLKAKDEPIVDGQSYRVKHISIQSDGLAASAYLESLP